MIRARSFPDISKQNWENGINRCFSFDLWSELNTSPIYQIGWDPSDKLKQWRAYAADRFSFSFSHFSTQLTQSNLNKLQYLLARVSDTLIHTVIHVEALFLKILRLVFISFMMVDMRSFKLYLLGGEWKNENLMNTNIILLMHLIEVAMV